MKLRALALAPMIVLAQAAGCDTGSYTVISDFCQRYQRQVLTRQEVQEVRRLSRNLQTRIQGNDVDYLCNCTGWSDPICQKARRLSAQR